MTTPAKKETSNDLATLLKGTEVQHGNSGVGGENIPPQTSSPRSDVVFRRLHEAATLPLYNPSTGTFTLFMCDITETGRPNVIVLPPHSISRPIPTGLTIVSLGGGAGILISRSEGLREGVFCPAVGVPWPTINSSEAEEIRIHLFNARHEAKRLIHGEPICDLTIVDGRRAAGPAEWEVGGTK